MIIFSFIQDNGPTLVNTVFVGERAISLTQSKLSRREIRNPDGNKM